MVPSDSVFSNVRVDEIVTVGKKLIARSGHVPSFTANTVSTDIQTSTMTLDSLTTTDVTTSSLTTETMSPVTNANLSTLNATSLTVNALTVTNNLTLTSPISSSTNVLYSNSPTSGNFVKINTSGETKTIALDSAQFKQNFLWFLDGSDGNVTISGGTTTLTKDMYYDTLTIDATGILQTANWVVFCKTACVNNGIIRNNGANGNNNSGTTGGTAGTATASATFLGANTGGNGGNQNANGGNNGLGIRTRVGGTGGAGGNSNNRTGGTVQNPSVDMLDIPTKLKCPLQLPLLFIQPGAFPGNSGSGGAGSTTQGGGGGGIGGGWLMILAKSVSGSGSFEATGGNGGNGGTNAGGGGGGGGGVVYILTSNNGISSAQVNVSGGSGGVGGLTTGGNGGVGQLTIISI